MKLQQLRFFVTVADELGFSKAAHKLHVAQPSLSVQIKALEEELGARLFERDKHHVFLTQAGKRFQQHARTILGMAETAKYEARCAAAGEMGTIDFCYARFLDFKGLAPRRAISRPDAVGLEALDTLRFAGEPQRSSWGEL